MLSTEDNELLCRSGRGTLMGDLLRQYWLPALPSRELPEADGEPKKVRLLGEDLVAFRDSKGRLGVHPYALSDQDKARKREDHRQDHHEG